MNEFEKIVETVGHDVAVVFGAGEKLVANLPKFIKAFDDGAVDAKAIVPLVQNVISAGVAFVKPAAAIGAAVAGAGTNLAADEVAIASVVAEAPALETQIAAFVAAVKALAVAIGADWSQLVADLETPAPAEQVTA